MCVFTVHMFLWHYNSLFITILCDKIGPAVVGNERNNERIQKSFVNLKSSHWFSEELTTRSGESQHLSGEPSTHELINSPALKGFFSKVDFQRGSPQKLFLKPADYELSARLGWWVNSLMIRRCQPQNTQAVRSTDLRRRVMFVPLSLLLSRSSPSFCMHHPARPYINKLLSPLWITLYPTVSCLAKVPGRFAWKNSFRWLAQQGWN